MGHGAAIDQGALVTNMLKGEALHDSARDMAASLAAQGSSVKSITNILMAISDNAEGVDPARSRERRNDLYRLAKSAVEKFHPEIEEPEPAEIGNALFTFADPESLPPRPFVYGVSYLRGYVNGMVAPGGSGKSTAIMTEALAMVSGKRLLHDSNIERDRPLNVWVYNLEEGMDELQRRFAALAKYYRLDVNTLPGNLHVTSGLETPLRLASDHMGQPVLHEQAIEQVEAYMKANQIDVFILDPFVSCHTINENDNGQIDLLVKACFARIAQNCDAAVMLVHHTSKGNGSDVSAGQARGASAFVGACRDVRVMNIMSENEAITFGIGARDRSSYVSFGSDKSNYSARGSKEWLHIKPINLGNWTDSYPHGDMVAVTVPWKEPSIFDGITGTDVENIIRSMGNETFRKSEKSPEWFGYFIANHMDWDAECKTIKKKLMVLIDAWLASGVLSQSIEIVGGKQRPVLVAGCLD